MKILTEEQLLKLNPQRRKALLQSVTSKVAKMTDDYLDFEPDMLDPEAAKCNNYRKRIRRLVRYGV